MEQKSKSQNNIKVTQVLADINKGESTKSFNASFNMLRRYFFVFALAMIISVGFAFYFISNAMDIATNRVFVLTNAGTFEGTPSTNPEERKLEIEHHVKVFLRYMFAFDEQSYKSNLENGLHLIDTDGNLIVQQYQDIKMLEKLAQNSMVIRVEVDSVLSSLKTYPYRARAFARQIIETPAGVVQQNLVCDMNLKDVTRARKNIHGLKITNFNVIDDSRLSE